MFKVNALMSLHPVSGFVLCVLMFLNVSLTHMNMFPTCSSLKVVPVGMSRGVKKLMQERFPNMSKFEDISELLMK